MQAINRAAVGGGDGDEAKGIGARNLLGLIVATMTLDDRRNEQIRGEGRVTYVPRVPQSHVIRRWRSECYGEEDRPSMIGYYSGFKYPLEGL